MTDPQKYLTNPRNVVVGVAGLLLTLLIAVLLSPTVSRVAFGPTATPAATLTPEVIRTPTTSLQADDDTDSMLVRVPRGLQTLWTWILPGWVIIGALALLTALFIVVTEFTRGDFSSCCLLLISPLFVVIFGTPLGLLISAAVWVVRQIL